MLTQFTQLFRAAIACVILCAVCAVGSAEPEALNIGCTPDSLNCDALMREEWCSGIDEATDFDVAQPYLTNQILLTSAEETSETLVLERRQMQEHDPPDIWGEFGEIVQFSRVVVLMDSRSITPEMRTQINSELKTLWVSDFRGPYQRASVFKRMSSENCYIWGKLGKSKRWFFQDFDFNAKLSSRLKGLLSLEEAPLVYVEYMCTAPEVSICPVFD